MDRTEALRDERARRHRARVSVATAIAGFAFAWPTYVHVWQHGAARPLDWRTQQVHERYSRPRFDVTREEQTVRVLLAVGPRSSTGYRVVVERVEEQRGRVLVVVHEESPGRRTRVEPRVTYPAVAVVFRDHGKPIEVERR